MTFLTARKRRTAHAIGWCLASLLAAHSSPASAQVASPRLSDGISLPSRNIASTDDASAVMLNPANLAFATGPEARFLLTHHGESSSIPARGYALSAALPFWVLGTGLHIDWLYPPSSTAAPFTANGVGHRYGWVRWGNAIRFGDWLGIGTTLAWSHSTAPALHNHFSVSSALTLRPYRFLSASFVARDWNGGHNEAQIPLHPSADVSVAVRPLGGHRRLEIGLAGSYRSESDHWVPGLQLATDIPYLGRLHAGAQLLDAERAHVFANAALDINFNRVQATVGALFGNSLDSGHAGFATGIAIRNFQESPSVPAAAHVLKLRLTDTPSVRQHARLLRLLWRLADSRELDGILLELRARPAPSLAHSEELVDALNHLRQKGKKVVCHLEDASGRELFVCSAADRIAINPAGGLRFAGLSTRHLYLGGLLDKLGVKADFVRIGAHKLAPEQFTDGSSPVGRRDHRATLDDVEQTYVEQIARGRSMSPNAVRKILAKGPFLATEARAANLIDNLVYADELPRFLDEVFGKPVKLRPYQSIDKAPNHWRHSPKIAVVYLHGMMVDGRSRSIPLLGIKLAGSYTVAKALEKARKDRSVRAVVLRVETGGGSSLASDVILREASLVAKTKPLIVSMGSAAASGGYYASVAAREIFANRSTITGSIGIFYGKADISGLLAKIGVKRELLRTAPRADAESLYRPFTEDERNALSAKVKQFYDLFIGRIVEGRKMSATEVHHVAQGRVWTGRQALPKGLIDKQGGLRQALARARELVSLPDDAPVLTLPEVKKSLFEKALELSGVPSLQSQSSWVPPPINDLNRALAPFLIFSPYQPLALMDEITIGP